MHLAIATPHTSHPSTPHSSTSTSPQLLPITIPARSSSFSPSAQPHISPASKKRKASTAVWTLLYSQKLRTPILRMTQRATLRRTMARLKSCREIIIRLRHLIARLVLRLRIPLVVGAMWSWTISKSRTRTQLVFISCLAVRPWVELMFRSKLSSTGSSTFSTLY